MPEPTAVARSPIAPTAPEVVVAGWVVSGCRSVAALTIIDCSPMAKVVLKAAVDVGGPRLGDVPFGGAHRQSWTLRDGQVAVLVVGSGPGEWTVLAPPGTQDEVVARLESPAARPTGELVSVLDLTHGRALVRITGSRSAGLLAKETAVDLSDHVCPDGAALRTAVSGLATDLIRNDRAAVPSYLLACERSSGQYLFDCLLDAGAELGIEVDGLTGR